MEDRDIRHLEGQIAASEERMQLRLENVMARIEGQIGRIAEQTTAIRQEISEQRADARALRNEVKTDIGANIEETRSSRRWVIGTIVGFIVAIGVAGIGVDIGLRQFWGLGVQATLAIHPTTPTVPTP
jgi:hypothetical protein